MTIRRYTGRVVEKSTQVGLPSLRVEAHELCQKTGEAIAAANTEERGEFTIEVDDAHILETLGTPTATVYFQVLDGEDILVSTDQTHRWLTAGDGRGRIEVVSDRPVGARPTPPMQVVEGIVGVRTGNTLGSGLTVKVYERRIDSTGAVTEVARGEPVTSALDGSYRVAYPMPASPTTRPDLVVKAEQASVVVATNTLCRAPARATIDVVVGGEEGARHPGVPRFNVVSAKVNRVLSESTPAPAAGAVQEAAYSYLACRAEVEEPEVAALIQAAQLKATYAAVALDVFYALIIGGIAKDDVLGTRLAVLRGLILRAVTERIIAPVFEDQIEDVLDDLESAAVAELSIPGEPMTRPFTPVGQLADLTPGITGDATKRGRFVALSLRQDGDAETFWSAVEADETSPGVPTFTPAEITSLKFSAEAAPLVRSWPAVITKLHELRSGGSPTLALPRDMAKLTQAEWVTLVTETGAPPGVAAADFAGEIYGAVGARFRTAAIGFRHTSSLVRDFIGHAANTSFEFGINRVARYVVDNPVSISGLSLEQKAALIADLKAAERVYKVTSSWDGEMQPLLAAGVTSARAIVELGTAGLEAISGFNAEAVESTLARAKYVSDASGALVLKYSAALNAQIELNSFPSQASADQGVLDTNGIPDWATCFGTLDQCACEHGRSVLSPSAYLVDLLQFLDKFGSTARAELFSRRPDIPLLLLSSANGDTALPQIDLTNEILEVRIAVGLPGTWPSAPAMVDTTRSTPELLAHPEIVYQPQYVAAYTTLAGSLYPFTSPFHLFAKEARVYLEYLGVPRHELIVTLAPPTGPSTEALAIERLDIAPKLYDLLSGTLSPAPSDQELWGYPASPPVNLVNELSQVSNLLRRGGITYDELLELLGTEQSADADIQFSRDGTCKLDELKLVVGATPPPAPEPPVTGAWLAETNRILRLRKLLGWSITDAAKAVRLLGSDETAIQRLGAIRRLVARTTVPPLEALAWCTAIDNWPKPDSPEAPGLRKRDPSLFARLFLNKAVLNPDEEAFQSIANGTAAGTIAARSLGLLPGLRITQADLDLLTKPEIAEAELQLSALVDGATMPATVANITQLVTLTSLARAASLRVRELHVLRALWLPSTSDPAESALQTFDLADEIKASGAPIDEIHFLVRNVAPASAKLEPTDPMTEKWLKDIEEGLAKAIADADAIEDATGEMLTSLLKQAFPDDSALRDQILAFMAKDEAFWKTAPASAFSEANALLNNFLLFFDDHVSTQADLIGTPDQSPPDPPDLPENTPPNIGEPGARRTYLTRTLARHANTAAFIKAWASATFALPTDVAAWLLETNAIKWHEEPSSGPPPVIDPDERAILAFTRQPSWTDGPKPSNEGRLAILMRLHKASLLASRFRWSIFDVKALYPNGASNVLPAINLDTLPIERPSTTTVGDGDTGRFTLWRRLGDLARLRDLWVGGGEALFAFFAEAARTATPPPIAMLDALDKAVSEATRWKLDDVAALRIHFGGGTNEAYADERLLTRMAKAMAVVRRLGASAAQAIRWGTPLQTTPVSIDDYAMPATLAPEGVNNSYAVATEIKRVAKAKHGDEAWAEIARPLRDVLRDVQRVTLVDHLLAKHPEWDSSNDLFANLMIDVEMRPAQLTSRLVLAHGTVQTFVNRILLHLEGSIPPNEEGAREWDWMKTYRVWEANRKVFLWPENWIEPELRDDKTKLFKQLETTLLQGPLDDERARAAFTVYLEGLSQVANLDIVAVHEEFVSLVPTVSVLHVFGKPRHGNIHYYRKRVDGEWSPWEKIDVEIEAEHLIPTTIGGRLYLFWPQYNTRAAGTPSIETPAQEDLGVRLAFSERRSTGWTAPKMGPDDFGWLGASPAKRELSFTVFGSTIEGFAELGTTVLRILQFKFDAGSQSISLFGLHPLSVDGNGNVVSALPNSEGTEVNWPAFCQDNVFQKFSGEPAIFTVLDPVEANYIQVVQVPVSSRVLVQRYPEPRASRSHFFLENGHRTLFLERHLRHHPATRSRGTGLHWKWQELEPAYDEVYFTAALFYHPHVSSFRQALAVRGIDGLLRWAGQSPKLQLQSASLAGYSACPALEKLPVEDVDFVLGTPYSVYNWELFFHAPLLIATRLSQQGRHADAQKWFHYIFDPTDGSGEDAPKRYWKVKPFYENDHLENIQSDLAALSVASQYTQEMAALAGFDLPTSVIESIRAQIERWRKDPFDPHSIARMRVLAYQKTVFIKYVQNLIAWGDQLFAQDSMESIAEATQLYIFAQELLGRRPVTIADPNPVGLRTYDQIDEILDEFSNAYLEVESLAPEPPEGGSSSPDAAPAPSFLWAKTYFCVPPNEKLLGLWDVVGDRLFKIRHSMNIEGIVRTLPLYQPPIDPALLVQAAAAGLDIGSVLNDLNVAAPSYRYGVLYVKAMDFIGSVISLGQTLLSTLEKQDSEALSNLRARHEVAMNDLVLEVRRTQVREARQNLAAVEQSIQSAWTRFDYYSAKPKIFPGEEEALDLQEDAQRLTETAGLVQDVASILHVIPDFTAGFPFAGTTWGPSFIANSLQAVSSIIGHEAGKLSYEATNTEKLEGYSRRKEDWDHQAALAKLEIKQIELNMLAAKIRLDIAEKELANLEKQIEHSREVERFLRSKFTNEDLYGWMKGQVQALYYQAYDLAFQMAKRAQKAFQYERGDDTQAFISFGSFDGSKAGLLAGEKLSHDLRRMDAAYHAQNKRELELVKTVSLAEHDPAQLVELRETGNATLTLTEDDYDRDFATHYMRRLKSVSVSVPCTTGPYQGVHGTLSLLKGATRRTPTADPTAYFGIIQNIATSQGQADSGMFELNFRDDRFLPFEGVGAHAELGDPASPQWKFELSAGNRFAFDTIDDLVLDVRYTARPGRNEGLPAGRYLRRLVRVRRDFATAWRSYIQGGAGAEIEMALGIDTWPQGRNETPEAVQRIQVYAWWQLASPPSTPTMQLVCPAASPNDLIDLGDATIPADPRRAIRWNAGALPVEGVPPALYGITPSESLWRLKPDPTLKASLKDVWIIFTYRVTVG